MTHVIRIPVALAAVATLSFSCGVEQTSDLEIRGGTVVSDGDLTAVRMSTVALTTNVAGSSGQSPLSQGKSFCSGTIIGMRTIVTAAHCIQALEGRTTKGDLLFPKAEDYLVHFDTEVSSGGDYIKAAEVIPHPDWNPSQTLSPFPSSRPNDIGLIILSEDIPDYMIPVEIADAGLKVRGEKAVLAGYGVTRGRNTNDTGVLRTLENSFSSESSNIARVSHGSWFKGICAGDSGGPAYAEVDGELQLVGAASTGIEIPLLGCIGSNSNSTDVRYYKDWINSNK